MAVLCHTLNKILFSKLFYPSNNIILCIVPLLDCYKLSLFKLILENFLKPLPWQIQGRGLGGRPHPSFLDQNEARRAEKNCFDTRPPLISWSGWPAPPLSEGLDPLPHYQMVFLEWHSSSLKNQAFQTVIEESNFPIFFCETEICLSIKYFALAFTDNVGVVIISVCVCVLRFYFVSFFLLQQSPFRKKCLLTLSLPRVIKVRLLLTISVHCQENTWEEFSTLWQWRFWVDQTPNSPIETNIQWSVWDSPMRIATLILGVRGLRAITSSYYLQPFLDI